MKEYSTDINFRRSGMEAVYLAGCALQNRSPELDGEVDLKGLFSFCEFHSISSIVAMSLERYWKDVTPAEPEQMKPWKQAKDMAIRKNILLNAERERIAQYLESIGCWYMPLKGSLLQHDYPKFGMRQMSDNDILIAPDKREDVHDFMCRSGYAAVYYGKGHQDEYLKKPVYNIEIHMSLFEKATDADLAAYYEDMTRLLKKDEANQYGYHLSEDDFYIYLIAHAYKHVTFSGIGIRHLLDVYVYLRKHGEALDRGYIRQELEKLGAYSFACQCEDLAKALFDVPERNPALSEEQNRLLDAFLRSGTYGTEEQMVDKSLTNLGKDGCKTGLSLKLRYFFTRIFPPVERMKIMYPELRENMWKLPLVYGKRLYKGIFQKRAAAAREMKMLFKMKSSDQ